MGLKVVLTPLHGVPSDETALAATQIVAQKFGARVDVMHVRPDPRTMIPYIGEGMSGALVEEMIASAEQQANERARNVRAAYDSWCAGAGSGIECGWIESMGRPDTVAARRGRVADLVVVSRPEAEAGVTTVAETLEAVLLESGTPILVAAEKAVGTIGEHVAIAWNGGLEAARAVSAAMPFLEAAKDVTVMTVGDPASEEDDAAALEAYLAAHGATVRTRNIETGGASVAAALLGAAGEAGADLMVMGAYTHSRLRELIFGGVTREVLADASLPVLMAH